jgi:hypothetical protein
MRLQYDCWDCQTAYDDGFGLMPGPSSGPGGSWSGGVARIFGN